MIAAVALFGVPTRTEDVLGWPPVLLPASIGALELDRNNLYVHILCVCLLLFAARVIRVVLVLEEDDRVEALCCGSTTHRLVVLADAKV